MSFYEVYLKYNDFDLEKIFSRVSLLDIKHSLGINNLNIEQFAYLLSEEAENYLEDMAQHAHNLTLKYFGRTVELYTPLYLSNYCDNQCIYCGFNSKNNIQRKQLMLEEVEKEAQVISDNGLKHILILTGESREKSPLSYIKDCVKILKKYFSYIAVEIYALSEKEYAEIIKEGAEGLTIYQEVYDHEVYDKVHLGGLKRDYKFRLEAPERAASKGMRYINIGALLGLADWRKEIFFVGLHAKYLQDNFSSTQISVSLPRVRPHLGDFKIDFPVSDKNIVQAILALRIFLPRIGITISTRENCEFRDNLIPLGITRMSAGSKTSVGGHLAEYQLNSSPSQFEISDTRTVDEIIHVLGEKGYQTVLKDWMHI